MKRILILGIDGYIGYALALDLINKGYEVCGLDNLSRRRLVNEVGSESLIPIAPISQRMRYLRGIPNFVDSVACIELRDHYLIKRVLKEYKPDTIIHLAEQPSAPWSMKNARSAIETQVDNVAGTLALLWAMKEECPEAHLIKLGTMGEYGTPNCDIPEGVIPRQPCLHIGSMELTDEELEDLVDPRPGHGGIIRLEKKCPMKGLPFPRSPGSFYHLSKVHDTHNIIFACKIWGLRSTDIMQGVVFGLHKYNDLGINETTRFDYDQYFGTVINRFCVQAITGHNLTVYGNGNQIRGFLPLKDSIQCLNIVIENPPKAEKYRTFNQFGVTHSINELALCVKQACKKLSFGVGIDYLKNPRVEADKHHYNPSNEGLLTLGYKPTTEIIGEIHKLIKYLLQFQNEVREDVIIPTTKWR